MTIGAFICRECRASQGREARSQDQKRRGQDNSFISYHSYLPLNNSSGAMQWTCFHIYNLL